MISIDDPQKARQQFKSFDPFVKQPSRRAPPGACDGQIHVFGPLERFSVRPEAVFEAPTATFTAAQTMHAVLGIERCVIVQSTVYGYDHSAMLDALKVGGDASYRGVVMVNEETTERDLRDFHDAGVRGARFNFFPGVNMISDPASFARCVAPLAEMGWFIKVHPPTGKLGELVSLLEPLRLQVQLDHYGRPDMTLGPDKDPTVELVAELLKRGNWWVMLSNAHRFSKSGFSMDDMAVVARRFYETASDRCVWASDWPHPLSTETMVNDGDVIDFLYSCFPTEQAQQDILVTNAEQLFQF
jgi:2-pyrone-4,6-dicarboxylate lactonase